jgi:hypothetical protein
MANQKQIEMLSRLRDFVTKHPDTSGFLTGSVLGAGAYLGTNAINSILAEDKQINPVIPLVSTAIAGTVIPAVYGKHRARSLSV